MTKTPSITTSSCCSDPFDLHAMPVEHARREILQAVKAIDCPRKIALRSALGGVLADDVLSGIDVPSHDNSAMDGFAVTAQDLPDSGTRTLRVIGTALAGDPFGGTLSPGEAIRIMTGALIPDRNNFV